MKSAYHILKSSKSRIRDISAVSAYLPLVLSVDSIHTPNLAPKWQSYFMWVRRSPCAARWWVFLGFSSWYEVFKSEDSSRSSINQSNKRRGLTQFVFGALLSTKDIEFIGGREFVEEPHEAATNCFIAGVLYILTFLFCGCQYRLAQRKARADLNFSAIH